jgi:competence protein ComEC
MTCVLRISNGTRTALLAGDIEQAQEARLAAAAARGERLAPEAADSRGPAPNGSWLRADVLLVPHHGSKTSSSEGFLDAVQPSVALVQAGYRNRFGHPAGSVVERYRSRDIAVIDSPHCGAALWRSDAAGAVACQREIAPRYWQHRAP